MRRLSIALLLAFFSTAVFAQTSCPSGYEFDSASQTCVASSTQIEGLPSAEDIAAIWSVGFSLVVICYLIPKSIASVLEIIRRG